MDKDDIELLAYEHSLAQEIKESVRRFNELARGAAKVGLIVDTYDTQQTVFGLPVRLASLEVSISKKL